MDNRFFDIDSNVYLNSLYILSAIYISDKSFKIRELLVSLYLIKNPSICIHLLDKKNRTLFEKQIKTYEFNNIQSEMIKYTSKIYTDGLNETLSYLFSKNIISYDVNSSSIHRGSQFDKLNFKKFPKDIILKATCANKIISKYTLVELEAKINDLWKVLL